MSCVVCCLLFIVWRVWCCPMLLAARVCYGLFCCLVVCELCLLFAMGGLLIVVCCVYLVACWPLGVG